MVSERRSFGTGWICGKVLKLGFGFGLGFEFGGWEEEARVVVEFWVD